MINLITELIQFFRKQAITKIQDETKWKQIFLKAQILYNKYDLL